LAGGGDELEGGRLQRLEGGVALIGHVR
jgi:hypothetical protein